MLCPSCKAENDPSAENCFKCGKGLFVLTEGYLLASRYRIVSPLGKGGMGMVYKAHDLELDEHVAIKVLRPEAATSPGMAKRFRSEIKLARRVSHPNVCRIHELGREGPLSYIVMEYVDGVDFKRILRERGRLPAPEAYGVALQIADALQAIHGEGIIHRDLKTPNVMRNTRGIVKLMDFGIAKSFEGNTAGTATATGDVVGTPEYMSPEQAQGGKVDARSDIYALGVVTFELFTAEVPFHSDTPLATLLKQIHDRPPLDETPELPKALIPTLRKALAKAPTERFQTAREFGEAVRLAGGPLAPTTDRGTGATPTPRASVAPLLMPETAPMPTPVPTAIPTVVPPPTAATPSQAGSSAPSPGTRPSPPVPSPPRARRERARRQPTLPTVVGTAAVLGLLVAGAWWWARSGGSPRGGVSSATPEASAPSPATPPLTSSPEPLPPPTLAIPEPVAPREGSELSYRDPARASTTVSWRQVPGASSYHLMLDRRSDFSQPLVDRKGVPGTTQQFRGLQAGEYYWRVAATGPGGQEGSFSTAMDFKIVGSRTDGHGLLAPSLSGQKGPAPPPPPLLTASAPGPAPASAPTPAPALSAPPAGPAPASPDAGGKGAAVPPRSDAAPLGGTLQLLIVPWAAVEVDGVKVGISPPLRPLSLAAGVHHVTLSHPDYAPFRRKVTIRPGETTKLQVDLTKEAFPK